MSLERGNMLFVDHSEDAKHRTDLPLNPCFTVTLEKSLGFMFSPVK